jgi:hypothetical protein
VWSWLGNPAVALLGLISSVITIVQVVALTAAFIKRKLPRTEGQRKRASVTLAWGCVATAAVVSPLTWHGIVTEAAKTGNPGNMADMYALSVLGTAFMTVMFLVLAARMGWGFPLFIVFAFTGSLTFAVAIDLVSLNVGWGLYLCLAGLASLGVGTLVIYPLTYARQGRTSISAHDAPPEDQRHSSAGRAV